MNVIRTSCNSTAPRGEAIGGEFVILDKLARYEWEDRQTLAKCYGYALERDDDIPRFSTAEKVAATNLVNMSDTYVASLPAKDRRKGIELLDRIQFALEPHLDRPAPRFLYGQCEIAIEKLSDSAPNSLRHQINAAIDRALHRQPDAVTNREILYRQLLDYYKRNARLPEFYLAPKLQTPAWPVE